MTRSVPRYFLSNYWRQHASNTSFGVKSSMVYSCCWKAWQRMRVDWSFQNRRYRRSPLTKSSQGPRLAEHSMRRRSVSAKSVRRVSLRAVLPLPLSNPERPRYQAARSRVDETVVVHAKRCSFRDGTTLGCAVSDKLRKRLCGTRQRGSKVTAAKPSLRKPLIAWRLARKPVAES
jgi:hypothetical protein